MSRKITGRSVMQTQRLYPIVEISLCMTPEYQSNEASDRKAEVEDAEEVESGERTLQQRMYTDTCS